jgi:hypothetical protein
VQKKATTAVAALALLAFATRGVEAQSSGLQIGHIPAEGTHIERIWPSQAGELTVKLLSGFNLRVTIHDATGKLLAEKICFKECELKFTTTSSEMIRIRIDNPEPEAQQLWLSWKVN